MYTENECDCRSFSLGDNVASTAAGSLYWPRDFRRRLNSLARSLRCRRLHRRLAAVVQKKEHNFVHKFD